MTLPLLYQPSNRRGGARLLEVALAPRERLVKADERGARAAMLPLAVARDDAVREQHVPHARVRRHPREHHRDAPRLQHSHAWACGGVASSRVGWRMLISIIQGGRCTGARQVHEQQIKGR